SGFGSEPSLRTQQGSDSVGKLSFQLRSYQYFITVMWRVSNASPTAHKLVANDARQPPRTFLGAKAITSPSSSCSQPATSDCAARTSEAKIWRSSSVRPYAGL